MTPYAKGEKLADYRASDHPALRKWVYAATTPEGHNVFMETQALVHPDYVRDVHNALSRSALYDLPLVRPVTQAQSAVKDLIMSFSLFHPAQIAVHAAEHKVFRREAIDPSEPAQRELIEHGLGIGAESPQQAAFQEGLMGGRTLESIPVVGKRLVQPVTDWTFQEFIPEIKMAMAKDALARNLEKYAPEMAAGKITRDQLVAKTAAEANAAFGEQNYVMMGRNPTLQHALRLALLAPDFLEARARFVGQAFKPYGSEQRLALARGAVAMFVLARMVNHFTGEDDPTRRPFAVIYKGREYGLRTVQGDIMHLLTSPRTFVSGRVSPVLGRTGIEMLTGRDWRGEPVGGEQMVKDAFNIRPIVFRSAPDRRLWENVLQGIGINEVPYRSAAMETARSAELRQLPRGPMSQQQKERLTARGRLARELRAGEIRAGRSAARTGGGTRDAGRC